WTAAVMGHWGDIQDLGDLHTAVMQCADGTLASGSRTFYEDLHLPQTQFMGFTCGLFGTHLTRVRGILLATTEALLPGGGPADHFTFVIGEGNDQVVERSL